jgi:hypothetical protein
MVGLQLLFEDPQQLAHVAMVDLQLIQHAGHIDAPVRRHLIPRLDLGSCMKPVHVATAQVRTMQRGSLRQEESDCCEA